MNDKQNDDQIDELITTDDREVIDEVINDTSSQDENGTPTEGKPPKISWI